jgi:endonuclease/exonuclease/phosphatase (EEP) superfamily protein YafD
VTTTTTAQRAGSDAPSRPWDSIVPHRPGQGVLVAVALLLGSAGLVAALLRIFPPTDDLPALLASFIPYGLVADAVALACLVPALLRARRRGPLAALGLAVATLAALQVVWLAPFFVPDNRPPSTRPFTVLSLNVRSTGADPDQIMARARGADIVVLLEVTPEAIGGLRRAGIDEQFVYAVGESATQNGSAIFSRFPLSDPTPVGNTSFQMWEVTALVPEVGPVHVIAAHPCNPFCGPGHWPDDHAVLRQAVSRDVDQPLVVAGDFNAVDDHGPIRALNATGVESATDVAGAGWLPTYPAGSWLPPLIPIDHVMISNRLTASSITRFRVEGTDHLGLLATLAGTR